MTNYAGATPQVSEEEKKEVKKYLAAHELRKNKRVTFENYWQDCLTYIVPRKEDVTTTQDPGSPKNEDLFDTTAIMANQHLAANLHGMLTNPTVRFFEFLMSDANLNEDDEVKKWLEDSANRVFTVMNNSNFQTEVHEIYIDEGAIGTACLFTGEHEERVVHFNARAMKEIYVDENNLGLIDTVDRRFKWKPKHIVQEFGEKSVHPWIMKKYEEGCEDEWEVLHTVCPGAKGDPESRGGLMAFKSVYILVDHQMFISKSGFREFPYAVPRWTKTSGEVYGRGPGMEMLPDIKMVNKMMETTLKGAAKTVDPPLQVSDDGVIGKVRLTPGGLTVTRPGADPIRPIITDARIDFGYQAVEDVRKRIRMGFYTDKMNLNDGPQKTATEVQQIVDEQWRFMGPVLGRQHFEFLDPVVTRVFAIMDRRQLFLPVPDKIKGKKIDVRYSSLAARAQRMQEGSNLNRALTIAAPVVNAIPQALDNLNGDRAIRHIFDVYGVPGKLLNDQREIKQIRDARAAAQEQAAKQAQEAHAAEVAGKALPGMAQMKQAEQVE